MNKCTFDFIKDIAFLNNYSGTIVEFGSRCFQKYNPRDIINHKKYIGYDLDRGNGVDVTNINNIPDCCADAIICSSMLEHDKEPEQTLNDISRIMKPACKILFTIPFNWPIHNYPNDYRRLTPDGLKLLLCKFKNVNCYGLGEKNNPHTVVGAVNHHTIPDIKKYYYEDGFIKGIIKNYFLTPAMFRSAKRIIHHENS